MTRSHVYLTVITLLAATLVFLGCWAQQTSADLVRRQLPAQRRLVVTLQLTDLALWSEARYTRHPAMADLFSPFQDFPGAPDHFPAGSLLAPAGPRPETTVVVRRHNESLR